MKKVKEIIGRLTAGSLRLAALFVVLGLAGSAWAADAPTITVNGSTVTIVNTTASAYQDKSLGMSSTWQSKNFTIPAGTGLASGTILKVSSISLGVSSSYSSYVADKLKIAGCVSSSDSVTSGGFAAASADKHTYSFADSTCLLKVGTGSVIKFLASDGSEITSGNLSFRTANNGHQFIDNLVWGGSAPVIEVVAEKVTGYINQTKDGFNTTDTAEKLYVSGVTGYLNTPNGLFGNVDELVVVDGEYTFGHKVVNGNSPNSGNPNRGTAFKKLSGTGTITNGDHGNGPTPVMGVCDTSEFAGSINIGSATTRLSVLFCTEAEINAGIETSLGASLYDLFTSESNRSRIYVSPGRTTANNAVVTVPAGKTWTAVNGIENRGELVVNGTVSCKIVNSGTLTVNGAATGAITGAGALNLNAAGSYNLGARRDFSNVTIASGVTLSITMTAEEYGKGTVSVTGANGISSITVFATDGTTQVTTLTPENGEAEYNRGSVLVSGKACWVDYEMNGNRTNTGVDTTDLQPDGYTDSQMFYNDSTLYTYTHPYRNNLTAYPANWTAVVRCTVPNLANAAIITFGNQTAGLLGLIAGDNPETQMKLVQTTGNSAYETKATMDVLDATSAQHVYVFAVENGQTLKCWSDGSLVLNETLESPVSIGAGFQIGSVVYGVGSTGIVRWWPGDTVFDNLPAADKAAAQIDCLRLYDYILSAEQISALSAEFPAVKLYRATAAADMDTTWTGDSSFTWNPGWDGGNDRSKVILTTEGNATIALPETITADEVELKLAANSTLTLSGPGSLAVTKPITIENGTLKLTGTVTLAQDLAFNGSVVFDSFTAAGTGVLKLAAGASVAVASGSVTVTTLGAYTLAEGTVVDASYTVEGKVRLIPLTSAVAEVDGQYYPLLATAVNATANSDATITLRANDSTAVTLSGQTIDENGNTFTGTLSGNGRIVLNALRTSAMSFASDWTGTVVLPEVTSVPNGGFRFDFYGKTGSTVEIANGFTGWLNAAEADSRQIKPTISIVDGSPFTISGTNANTWYNIARLTGAGNFSLVQTNPPGGDSGNAGGFHLLNVEDYTGTIANSIGSGTPTPLTISKVTLAAAPVAGQKLVSTTTPGTVNLEAVYVGNEQQTVDIVKGTDGIYVAAATVQKGETVTSYATAALAMAAAGNDAATITLLCDTASDISLAVGQTLVTDGFSVGDVTTVEHYHVVEDNGTYTVVIDTVNVTVPSVENASVSVQYTVGGVSATDTSATTYAVDYGTAVTVTYTADTGYFINGQASNTVVLDTVTTSTEITSQQAGSTTAAVAQDSDGGYYPTVYSALEWLAAPANFGTGYVQLLGETVGENIYGDYGVGYDAAAKRYAKAAATVSGTTAGYLTVQEAINVVANEGTVNLKADNAEELTLANGKTVTIKAKQAQTIYTYTPPVAAGDYTVDAGETVEGVTTYTARDWDTWTLELGTYPNATVTGLPVDVSEGDAVADRTVSFTVTADATYKVTAVKVDGAPLVGDNGTYTYTVSGDATVTVETELDVMTFTVVVPANMTVTVDGEPYTADAEITRNVGATVTIVYTVTGAYAGNTQQQVITVGADTPASIATPADYVAPVPAVAQINTTYYASLRNAFEAAAADATIKVIADNTMTGNAIAFEKSLTLDLNGFVTTHMGDGHAFEPTNGATFTITDTSDGAAGKVVSGSKIVLSGSPCTFTLTAGMLESDSVPVYIWGNGPASERVVNINGGKLVCGSNSNADSCIMVSSGTIRMSAGVIESVCCGFEGTTVNVSGGNVTVGVDKVFRRSTDRATGGTFNKDVGDYCTTGYICVNNGNGTYSVVSGGVIKFVNDDGTTVLQTLKVPTGDTPAYTGETPTKTATAQYTYTFTGWYDGTTQYGPTDALPAVTGDVTYTATYSSTVNEYTITWKNDDGSTIDTTQVAYGTVPTHADAEKAATAEYIYTFNGWTPEVVAVNGNATYTATYTSAPNTKTFTVVVPANTVVTVGGVNYTETFQLTETIGTVLQLTYTPVEGYAGTEVTESVTVTVATETVSPSTYVAPVPAVAQVGSTYYETLQAALGAAQAGDTVTLLADVDFRSQFATTSARYPISKSLTIDGANHTIQVAGRGFGVGVNATSNVDVTFKDVTIVNASYAGRCIDTRGNLASLTLDHVTLDTTGCPGGYNQPLTIGGNQATAATVTIKNGSVIQTNNEGTAYYAIITFNPVNMTITDSTIKGWACIYAKGPDGSAGSAGSVFTITDSTLVSKNVYSGETNAFGLIVTEDNDIDVSITGTTINIDGASNTQAILTGQRNNNLEGVNVALGEDNVVTLANSATFATNCSDTLRLQISGGRFNIPVPENCCADGCIPTEIEPGVYSVRAGGYVARIGTVKYETLAEAMAAAQNGDTVVMLLNTTLAEPLNIELGTKAVTLDLGGKTLTGRTNLKNGNLTVQNGTVAGGAQQALNVYGSATPAEKYSVLTIAADVAVTADVYGVCLFGPTYNAHNGYGAVINIAGTVSTTGDSNNGAVFVSGNLGWYETGDANNVINVTGSITSATDAAIALNGLATVNVSDGVAVGGNTAIAVKRGTLKVTGGTIHATGADNTGSVSGNNNGAEMTGAAISITPTYSKYGPLSVAISGGTIYSDNAVALFKKESTYQSAATVAVSGGRFSSPVLADFCAVSCTPCELGEGWYSVEIAGTYDVEVPVEVATEEEAQAIAEAATVEDIKLPVEVAAELKTDDDVAAYQSAFKYEVQESNTGYTVTPVLDPEATVTLTGDTEATPVKAVSTGADMEGEAKIEIKTIPGLYYSVSVSDTVDGAYAPVGESADATMATAKTMKLDVDDIVPEEAGSTKYIKVTTTATSNQTGAQVKSTTTVGVMKTDTPKKLEIVPVPWKGVGEENATVKVSDIIKTSTLDEGAKIHVADGENGYNTWKLQGGKWVALNTTVATQSGPEVEPEAGVAADSIDVPQGGAFWVEQETPKPIVMIGEVGTPPTKKEVAAGTSGLCASPKGEEFSLSDITGVGVNDSITVLDEDGKPINLSYRNGGWKVLQFNTTTRKNEWATPDADLLKIKAGAGFWFNNHSGSKRTINWNR